MGMPGYHSTATTPGRRPTDMSMQSTSTAFGKIVSWWETENSIGVLNDQGKKAYFGKKFASETAQEGIRQGLEYNKVREHDVRLKFNRNRQGKKQYTFFKWIVVDRHIDWDNYNVY